MKSIILLIFSIILLNTYAQNVGIGTNNPNTEAKLDIQSTNSGLLIPRMTSTQRLSIADETTSSTTANGMLIYDITLNKLMIFDSTANSYNGKWYVLEPTINVWKTQGNSGTNVASNFIGTTDSVDLVFKNKNNQNMRLYTDGSWLIGDSMQGIGKKTYFDISKSAFRSGYTSNRFWDKDSIGTYSFACGLNTKAKGIYAIAMGFNNKASGYASVALGSETEALGSNSFAMGNNTIASGNYSTALGHSTSASGLYSTAMGYATSATGDRATSIGYGATANNNFSTSIGTYTLASGEYSIAMGRSSSSFGFNSTSMGYLNLANGDYSTVMGNNVMSNGFSSLVIGQYNDTIVTKQSSAISTTPLFIIGNGTSTSRSNAMVVRQDGNIGIGTNAPTTNLDVNGTTKTSNFQMTSGAGANKLLQSDASGNASWITPVDMNTDSQSLNLTGTTLSISRGNSIDLSTIETDPQVSSATNNRIPRWNGTTLVDGLIQDDASNIGIGTAPISGQKLSVNGKTTTINFQMTIGAGANKILQSDASGNASWVTPIDMNTDSQSLYLTGTTLSISRGNSIDLSTIETDPQVSSATSNRIPRWNGTTLVDGLIQDDASNIGIGTAPISGQKLSVNGKTTTTNFQMTTGAGANKILQSDASGNATWVTPTDVDTDTQSLRLTGTNLTISRGNTIDLSSIETDPQVSSTTNNRIPRWNGTTLVDGLIQDDASNIGIGTAPVSGQKLTINGKTTTTNFQLTNNAAKDKWLKSDSLGNAIWDSLDAAKVNAWGLSGNANSNPTSNFIGTSDSIGLNISTNNQSRLNIGAFGTLGLKTNAVNNKGINQFFIPKTLDSSNYGFYQDISLNGAASSLGFKNQYGSYQKIKLNNSGTNTIGSIFGDYKDIILSDAGQTTNFLNTFGQYINITKNGKNNYIGIPIIIGSKVGLNISNDSSNSILYGNNNEISTRGYASPSSINGSKIYISAQTDEAPSDITSLYLNTQIGKLPTYSSSTNLTNVQLIDNLTILNDNYSISNFYASKNYISIGDNFTSSGATINNLYGYHLDINTFDFHDNIDTVKAFYANFDYTTNKRYGLYINGEGYNFLSGNLGIGVLTPSSKLEVNGKTKTTNFQMTSGAGANKILQSDAIGNASWIAPTDLNIDTQSLSLTGSTLSISRGNSIDLSSIEIDPQVSSTTSNQVPKWNGTALVDGIITDNTTAVGIGMTPVSRLDISNGNLRVSGLGNTDTSADNDGTGGVIIWNNNNGIGGGVARKVERMTKGQLATAANSVINFYDDPFLQFRIIRNGSGAGSTIYLEIAPKSGATGDYSISTTDGSLSTFISAATVGAFISVALDLRNADAAKEFSISKRAGNNQAVYRIVIHKNSANSGTNPEAFNITTEAYY